jgi:hypothetical protein
MTFPTKELVPAAQVAQEFGIVRRTLARWLEDDSLHFPKPEIIRGRWYFRRGKLDSWEPPARKTTARAAAK